MNTKTNIFFHATKELTPDVFLVWLLYFLDSGESYDTYKQLLFDSLILKNEDRGRVVCRMGLKQQKNNDDVLLSFCFKDNDEQQTVLFENETWTMPHSGRLSISKKTYPNCYRYFYYKLGYINSQEEQELSQRQYEIIDAGMMSSALEKMGALHPLIKMYNDYIVYTFVNVFNSYHDKLFVKHDYNVLWNADAQKYFCDAIVENMTNQNVHFLEIRNGTSYGRPWTQIDIAEKKNGYSERLFWRVDIRSGKFCIRLNQYADPSEGIAYKRHRIEILREEANRFVSTIPTLRLGKVHNSAIKESEVLIFFLEDNDFETLLESLPKISRRIMDVFQS